MRYLLAVLICPVVLSAAEYRVDCAAANWQTLDAVNALELKPGDRLLLKAGCRWTGTLSPRGSGVEKAPVVIDRYGEGAAPRIDGNGAEAAILLRNQEFIEVRRLEVTNDAAEPGLRRGVLVRADNLGRALHHVYFSGLDIHNVKGKLGADMVSKCTGGIGFEIGTKQSATRLDDIVIENNRIHTVDNMGIYINTDSGPHPRDPQWEALRHTRVVVRGNQLDDIGKNAMCIRASLEPLIEKNVIRRASARLHGNAIYVFGCKNAVMQHNDVGDTTYSGLEGAAFDSDYNSEGTLIQYNYSHNNGGGLVDLCNNPAVKPPRGYNDGTVIRYNVSRNDIDRVIAFDGTATNTQIYNNTLYIGRGLKPHIVEFDLFGQTPGYADRTQIRNNIIVNEGEGTYVWGKATNFSFDGNCFAGNHPANEPDDPHKVTTDPQFTAPDTVGDTIDSVSGFALKAGSPCLGNSVAVPGGGGTDLPGNPLPALNRDRGAFQHPAVEVVRGIVFDSPQGIQLKADVYLPRGTGPFPAVVYLHGGGWSQRQRQQLRKQATHFASLGILGFAPEYRLANEAPFPASLYDAKAAVRWLRANARKYNIDPERIAAAGSSAGGNLAALLGVTNGESRYEGDGAAREFSSGVRAVAIFNPVLDMTDMAHREPLVTRLLGGKCEARKELCREASPIAHVSKSSVPFLLMSGTGDETVPYRQIEAMAGKLRASGVEVEVFTAPGAPHTFWNSPRWYDESLEAMQKFLMEHLLEPKQPGTKRQPTS